MNIAIDGPAGAGKSSIAKLVAKEISFIYVDTGAMFRAMALFFMKNGIDTADENAVSENCDRIEIRMEYEEGVQHIILNGEDVSEEIRQESVGENASVVAKYDSVRTKLLNLQRSLAAASDVIMDGRDIGTVVLPEAEVKIFLTASVEVRAKRRYKELREKGEECDYEKIEQSIVARDYQDMHRAIAPLKKAEDAILLDTSDMTIPQVVSRIRELAGYGGDNEN